MKYELLMRDDGCSKERIIEADDLAEARDMAEAATRDWIEGGEWGSEGASVPAWWTLTDESGEEVADGSVTVDIEPDHDSLIRAAGGDPDCDHDWTSEGEGGCDENPGVWSTGGTAMVFVTHCAKCGLRRVERSTGDQLNPGEHDTVSYTQPANWCEKCQRDIRHVIDSIRYTDDDEQPIGEYVDGFGTQAAAEECARETVCRRRIDAPDRVVIALDDRANGTGTYDVFILRERA